MIIFLDRGCFCDYLCKNYKIMKSNNSGRKSPRAQWHDYNGAEYFVTICTKNMVHYFGEITDGEIQLTEVGEYLKYQIENIHNHYVFAEVLLYTIMPNHLHMIIAIDGNKIPYNRSSSSRDVACRVQNNINKTMDAAMDAAMDATMDATLVATLVATLDAASHVHTNETHILSQDAASHVPTGDNDKNKYMEYISNKQSWLSVCIGSIKSAVTKYANQNNISFAWQTRYNDHIIRNQNEMNRIAQYIKNNPIVWK